MAYKNNKQKKYNTSEKFNHDTSRINPLNDKQTDLLHSIDDNDITFAIGYPGSAKTLLSIYKAFEYYDNRDSSIDSIIVTRNITDAEGSKSIGALPGELVEKTQMYLEPIYDNLNVFMSKGRLNYVKDNNVVQFIPYEFIRGRSFNHSFIIVEEAQNFTAKQMYSVLTRIGSYSKMVVNGDYVTQRDLPDKFGQSGLEDAIHKLKSLNNVGVINFDSPDYITRSGIVKDIIIQYFS